MEATLENNAGTNSTTMSSTVKKISLSKIRNVVSKTSLQ